jgi:TctA family transporter
MSELLLAALAGALLGAVTGLLPGVHPNALAALALGALPALPLQGEPLAAGLVAMAMSHQFTAAIPGSFLGAPAPEQGLQVLPAQELLHEGRAFEAVELAALGAAVGVLVGALLLAPLRALAGPHGEGYRWLEPAVPLVLAAIAAVLLGTEPARLPLRRALRAEPFPAPGAPEVEGTLARREADALVIATAGGERTVHDPLGLLDDAEPGQAVVARGTWTRMLGRGGALAGVGLAACVFALAGLLGLAAQGLATPSPLGLPASPMLPLLTGLFGVPALVLALRSPAPPPQHAVPSAEPARALLASASVGAACGALVGLLPGMSSSAASVLALVARRDARREGALVTLSAAGASAAVVTAGAFVLVQRARSGPMLAVADLVPPSAWPGALPPRLLVALLLGCAAGALVGFAAALLVARWLAPRFHRVPYRALSLATLLALVALVGAFAGPWGLVLLLAASLVGLLPWRLGLRRGHLMGCTMGPLILRLRG